MATDHLHACERLELGDTIVVRLDQPANVMLLDEDAYWAYLAGSSFPYQGGWVKEPQIALWPPRAGRWHVIVDLGDREGQVQASVQVLRG